MLWNPPGNCVMLKCVLVSVVFSLDRLCTFAIVCKCRQSVMENEVDVPPQRVSAFAGVTAEAFIGPLSTQPEAYTQRD